MKTLHTFLCFMLLTCLSIKGQSLYTPTQKQHIEKQWSETLKKEQQIQATLKQWALSQRIPMRQTFADGTVMLLTGLTETGHPLYEITHTNRGAASTTRTETLYEGGILNLSLNGSSAFMRGRLGIWDGGAVLATHNELVGRVEQKDGATATDGHATHVAGTMIAQGINPRVRGMSFGGTLQAYDFSSDNTEMARAAMDLLLSNHSYGTVAGWRFNAARSGTNNNLKWEWYGDTLINAEDDYKFGFYNEKAREWDRMSYNAPYYLIVCSAGNNRGNNGPPTGTPYFIGASNRTSTTPRVTQNGYDLIATQGNAKNTLTVGAIGILSNGYNLISDPRISTFSSWGPTDDGRIKPDIVGVGVSVLSTTNTNNSAYTSLSGTSMASPNVTGSIFLLQELWRSTREQFMRASTLKGLILHTADDAGNVGPDYQYGWGLLDIRQAAVVVQNTDGSHLIAERTLATNDTYTLEVVASGRGPLVATICWTDPEAPASTATASNFNNRTPKLINDLDLRISDGTNEILPWVLNPDKPADLATRGDNIRDNVEQVLIANAIPGKVYTITVKHKATITNNLQPYALIVSGVGGKTYCESKPATDAGLKITQVSIGNVSQIGKEGCQTYNNYMGQVIAAASGQTLSLSVSTGSCNGATGGVIKAFIDWNLDGDFEDANETVAAGTVLSNGVLTRPVVVPSGIVVGQFTRLRIIASESSDPNVIVPCGTYARGETQEYLLQFVRPARDVTPTGLILPETSGFCAGQAFNVSLKIRNNGQQTLDAIPVEIEVRNAQGQRVALLTQTLTQSLEPFKEASVAFNTEALNRLDAGQTYQFIARTRLSEDQDTLNNQIQVSRTVAGALEVKNTTAAYCAADPVALISRDVGTAYWYDSPFATLPIAIGNLTSLSNRLPNNIYYVSLNDFKGGVGPPTKATFGGGSYAPNFGPQPLIKTEVPLVLESARLYTATAGKITFTVQGLDDSFISTTTIDTRATRTPNAPNQGAPAGQIADDPNDMGQVYALNLPIPVPGDYKITIEYEDGATIFRSNVGVNGFPFKIPNVITLKGALFEQNNRVDTITNAYYYLFDLRVKSFGCPSTRVPITAQNATKSTPTISFDGPNAICEGGELLLKASNNGEVYQWFLNNQPIKNANAVNYNATQAGTYSVSSSINNCLPTLSNPVTFTIRKAEKPIVTLEGITLKSNVPTNNQWFLNSLPIQGATGQVFTAYQTGRYSVRANANGCGDALSDEVTVVITSLADDPNWIGVGARAYPNPTSQKVICEWRPASQTSGIVSVTLYDALGQKIMGQLMQKVGENFSCELNLQTLQNGTFFALIEDKSTQTRSVLKIVKKH